MAPITLSSYLCLPSALTRCHSCTTMLPVTAPFVHPSTSPNVAQTLLVCVDVYRLVRQMGNQWIDCTSMFWRFSSVETMIPWVWAQTVCHPRSGELHDRAWSSRVRRGWIGLRFWFGTDHGPDLGIVTCHVGRGQWYASAPTHPTRRVRRPWWTPTRYGRRTRHVPSQPVHAVHQITCFHPHRRWWRLWPVRRLGPRVTHRRGWLARTTPVPPMRQTGRSPVRVEYSDESSGYVVRASHCSRRFGHVLQILPLRLYYFCYYCCCLCLFPIHFHFHYARSITSTTFIRVLTTTPVEYYGITLLLLFLLYLYGVQFMQESGIVHWEWRATGPTYHFQ